MNLKKTLLVGSLWAVGMRWGIRALGLISLVVLARLLKPEDFGILAMAMILISALVDSHRARCLGDAHSRRRRDPRGHGYGLDHPHHSGPAHRRSGRGTGAASGGVLQRAKDGRGRLGLAAAVALNAFENIGVVMIRKELDFAKDFRYQVYIKIAGVVGTIALAFWLRSYWALALAKCVTAVAHVALSYAMHPYRPRLSLANYRRFLGFSSAVVLTGMARVIGGKTTAFIVASIGGASRMGEYAFAGQLSSIGPSELTMSVGRAMFPTLARLRNAREKLIRGFLKILGTVAMLCLPMGFGVWVVADDLVPVLLGPKWDATRDLMKYLAISGTTASLVNIMIGHVMIITGHHHRQTLAQWIRCGVIVACALVGSRWGVEGVAAGSMVAGIIMFCITVVLLKITLSCRIADFVAVFWRPMLASFLMALIVHYFAASMDIAPALRLMLSIALGVVSYAACCFFSGCLRADRMAPKRLPSPRY